MSTRELTNPSRPTARPARGGSALSRALPTGPALAGLLSLAFGAGIAAQSNSPFTVEPGSQSLSSCMLQAADQYGWVYEFDDRVSQSKRAEFYLSLPLSIAGVDAEQTLSLLAIRRGACGIPTEEGEVTRFVPFDHRLRLQLEELALDVERREVEQWPGRPDQWVRTTVRGFERLEDTAAQLGSCLGTLGVQVSVTTKDSGLEAAHVELQGRVFEVQLVLGLLDQITGDRTTASVPRWLENWRHGPPGAKGSAADPLSLKPGEHNLAEVLRAAGRAQGANYLIDEQLAQRSITLERAVQCGGMRAVENWLRELATREGIHRIPLSAEVGLAEWASTTGPGSASTLARAALVTPNTALGLTDSDLPIITVLRPSDPREALRQIQSARGNLAHRPQLAVVGERFVLRGAAYAVVESLQVAASPSARPPRGR